MPMNGLLTLADVADQFHRGAEQGLQYAEADRQKKQRDLYDQAGQAASKYIDGLRAQHILNGGAPEAFKPSSADVLKASEEFGKHLYKGGDFKGFLNNEVNVAPLRLRAISDSLRQYQLDKDPAKLAQAVLAIGGQEVEGVEMLPGGASAQRGTAPTVAPPAGPNMATRQGMEQGLAALDAANTNPLGAQQPPVQPGLEGIVIPGKPGDGRLGAPSGPAQLRIKLAGGKVQMIDPATLEQDVMQSLQDPAQTAQELVKLRFATMTQRMKTQEAIAVERERGGQARQTEAEKAKARAAEGQQDFQRKLTLADADHAAALARTRETASATRESARIRAGGEDGDGTIKTLAQANRAVETARNALNQAVTAATKIRLEGQDGLQMKGDARAAAVEADPEVTAARQQYRKAIAERDRIASGEKKAPTPAPGAGGKDYSNLWSK